MPTFIGHIAYRTIPHSNSILESLRKRHKYTSTSIELQELSQRLFQGEAKAIELIYRSCFHKLLYYGVQVAGINHQSEVEDVIQEFFIWLAGNREKVDHIKDFETYMFQCIRRNLQAKLSKLQKSQETFERYINRTAPLRDLEDSSPEQLHIQKEELEIKGSLVHKELNRLPPYLKEVLYLRYLEDKSYAEIAAILSINDQVAYNYVSRAIKRLKQQFAGMKSAIPLVFGLLKMTF